MSLKSSGIAKKLKELNKPTVGYNYVINRNPRNLERLRIAYKPSGYHLEKPGREFWHKLEIKSTGRYVYAEVKHFENGPIIIANTNEWAIKKFLYKTNDTCAYINLARILAQRCLEAGILEMRCDIKTSSNTKLDKFLKVIQENGVCLTESERFTPHRPWNEKRPEKPWNVTEKMALQ